MTCCEIYGYCLMGNHAHLLIKETKENISQIMERIGTRYSWWYNWKYERVGHVFQDRFKSECIEDYSYLLTVIRYIHNNPVKAKIVDKSDQYRWSNNFTYCGGKEYPQGLTKIEVILKLLSEDKKAAIEKFHEFMEQENNDKCLEDKKRTRV